MLILICSPNPGLTTQAGLWSIFHLFVQNRTTEDNMLKFHKVKFINLEDFSLFRQSVSFPCVDIKRKILILKFGLKLFYEMMTDSHSKSPGTTFWENEMQIR